MKERQPWLGRPLMTPRELQATIDSVDAVASLFPCNATYVELGVRRADTSARVIRRLDKQRERYAFFGVDCDLGVKKQWERKIDSTKHIGFTNLLLETTESAKDKIGLIHWCLCDACHCRECAMHDIESYGSKIILGGILLIHDTAPHKSEYAHMTQHDHTRPYGVLEAIKQSIVLREHFELEHEVKDSNGLQVWRRTN